MDSLERSVGRLLRDSLESGSKVEIEGLGTFLPGKKDGFRFVAQTRPAFSSPTCKRI
jgi:hypothetical protein